MELGPAVDAQGSGGRVFGVGSVLAVKNEVGADEDQVDAVPRAGFGAVPRRRYVQLATELGVFFAVVDLRHGRRMDEDVGAKLRQHPLEILGSGRIEFRIREAEVVAAGGSATRSQQFVAALRQVEQRLAQQAVGARHQDAQGAWGHVKHGRRSGFQLPGNRRIRRRGAANRSLRRRT